MAVNVYLAKKKDQEDWRNFVRSNAPHTHTLAWSWGDIIKEAFSHKPYFLLASKEEKIIAACPVFLFRSPLFGKSLVSVPYLNGGGILAISEEGFNAILEKLITLSNDLKCNYIELRHRKPYYENWPNSNNSKNSENSHIGLPPTQNSLVARQHKVCMKMKLKEDSDELFKSFPAKLRSQIRRPTKSGLVAKTSGVDLSVEDSVTAFYKVFSEHMRDLGTPVYPKTLFQEACRRFGNKSRVITVWDKKTPVAAGITIGGERTVEIPWAASLRRYSKQSANMLLYWRVIEQACQDQYSVFDFGRSSPDAGTFKFKKQWGAVPMELNWYYHMNTGEAPDVNPSSGKFALMVNVWKRLPLVVSNQIGPVVTRWIP